VTNAGDRELHLTPEQTAGYLHSVLTAVERATVEAHLAACVECRDEVVALRPLVSAQRSRRRILRAGIALGAAAAAAVVLLVQPGRVSSPEPAQHRDLSQGMEMALAPITPAGPGSRPVTLAWSSLDQAKRYRVLVFDAEGTILYRAEAGDSVLPLPDSLRLSPGQPYFWKVEADTGWDRWVSSRLVEFSVGTIGKVEP
jgi:anti-sigma factor RsiW